jgi:hypothetical protein
MGSIPIEIQRRVEQRWAARFPQQPPSSKPPEKHQFVDQGASGKSKTEARGEGVIAPVERSGTPSPHRPCFG